MAVEFLSNRLKALILVIIGAVRRALCCFRRRRRASCEPTPLTGIGIGDSTVEMGDSEWKSWEAPTSVVSERSPVSLIQQQIEQYRHQSMATQEAEPEPDLFEDMTPRITAQPRILLNTSSSNSSVTSRSLAFDPTLAVNSELERWEDNPTSWEEGDDIDPDALLRDKQRQERERRKQEQMSRRSDKYSRSHLGARIS